MPWWAEGCEQTGKMVISYDNLIRRLWLHGAIEPFPGVDALLTPDDMPPIPHDYWVHRLGFQQTDPVTDFRSGGVLSLAMMVHIAESCPVVFSRFVGEGDASVLPFGITSINITDMMSKFLMLAKTVDRMDALLSQKPFWRMFADPNALTSCQELAMDMLADVVVELAAERRQADQPPPTVFDFAEILARTERRVQYDLLGAGPKTVPELYQIHQRLKLKYQAALQQRLQLHPDADQLDTVRDQVVQRATGLAAGAQSLAGNVLSKIKVGPNFNPLAARDGSEEGDGAGVSSAAPVATTTPAAATAATNADDDDWAGTEIKAATDAVSNFSIGGDDDEEEDEDAVL